MNPNLIQLLTHNNARNTTFTKTLKLRKLKEILSSLAQINIGKYQPQLDALSLELIGISQQTNNPPKKLNNLIKKYQELIRLILISLAGSSSEGAGTKLQMLNINHKKLQKKLIKITKEINKLLEENIQNYQNPYAASGELLANIIIGIFSFFISDLEELDEQTKKELNQELTVYKQQQKSDNIITQVNLILNQLHTTPKPAPIKSTAKDGKNHFFPKPFTLTPTPGGNSIKEQE